MAMTKRTLLTGALTVIVGYAALRYGAPLLGRAFSGELQFKDMVSPRGFRHLKGGRTSVGIDPFVGLDRNQDAGMAGVVSGLKKELCVALFGSSQDGREGVPIASFSDYYCPYCRLLTPRLANLEQASKGEIQITWHELPLLGENSVLAARGALAAGQQGAYVAFHERLMRAAFLKTPEYIQQLALDLGIDGDRLAADMVSPEIQTQIQRSLALARILGLIGTPAIVVGNTVVQGQIDEHTLARLIERERVDGPFRACN